MKRADSIAPQALNLLVHLRQELNRCPEPAGSEENTRVLLRRFFQRHAPGWHCQLCGQGSMAWIREGNTAGPTRVFRAELDAVPPVDDSDDGARSVHRCGHDGHMAILAGLALLMEKDREFCGRIVLLFQSAEEDGTGALAVCTDPRFHALHPAYIFALHNLPGWPAGKVVLRNGGMCCASRGVEIRLRGKPAHAAQPEDGRSPAKPLARMIEGLEQVCTAEPAPTGIRMATVIGARLGEKHFGSTPKQAVLWATLRAETDRDMDILAAGVEDMIMTLAAEHGMLATHRWSDVFPAVFNDPKACALVETAAERAGVAVVRPETPFRWSEDFAHYGNCGHAVLIGFGSGEGCPPLHTGDYAFPDEIIPTGVNLLYRIACSIHSKT